MSRCQSLWNIFTKLPLRFSFITLLSLLISACNGGSVILVNNINQNTANLIVLQLGQNNISADKKQDKDLSYSIYVTKKDQIKALNILHINGTPNQQYSTLGEVFKKDSFISSPLEEQGRFIYALQQQISKMLSQMEGVIDVECQVSLAPSSDNLWQNDQIKPAAAVFIKYKNGYRLDLYVNRIKQLVANSVPGLSPERVEVLTMSPVLDK